MWKAKEAEKKGSGGLDKMVLGVKDFCPFCRFCLKDDPGAREKVVFDCPTAASRADSAPVALVSAASKPAQAEVEPLGSIAARASATSCGDHFPSPTSLSVPTMLRTW